MVHYESAALPYGSARGESWRRRDSDDARGRLLAFPNGRQKISLIRVLLALCIVAALVMAAYKPARGGLADTRACAAATAGNGTAATEYCSRSSAFVFERD